MRPRRMAYEWQNSVNENFGLMCNGTAKRWGRWFVFAWLAMWLSTALLPCSEVLAAVATHERALSVPDAVIPQNKRRPPVAASKSGACLDIAGPAPASPETVVAGGHPMLLVTAVRRSVISHPFPPGARRSR